MRLPLKPLAFFRISVALFAAWACLCSAQDAPQCSFGSAPMPENWEVLQYLYPEVYNTLDGNLKRLMETPKPVIEKALNTKTLDSGSDKASCAKRIERVQKALSSLEYYQKNLTRDELNQTVNNNGVIFGWISEDSVRKLTAKAREWCQQNNVPPPAETDDLPPQRKR